jgi:hypothetical protein
VTGAAINATGSLLMRGAKVSPTELLEMAIDVNLGISPATSDELDMLLELAGVAAHASERPAAPITCWLVGRAGMAPRDALAVGHRLAACGEAIEANRADAGMCRCGA